MKFNLESLGRHFHPIHKDGYIFIAVFAFAALMLNALSSFLGMLGLVLTLWCIYFFRNPSRFVPQKKGLVLAAADGVVIDICKARPPAELDIPLDREFIRISTYLSLLDVHIQRLPVSGTIERIEYSKGKFLNATDDKASDDNERNSIIINTDDGFTIPVVQIAGYIGRRIACWTKEGKQEQAGERYGMIRFGSRVDIYLPAGIMPQVAVGQKMVAGETVIANLGEHNEATEAKEI